MELLAFHLCVCVCLQETGRQGKKNVQGRQVLKHRLKAADWKLKCHQGLSQLEMQVYILT